MSLAMVIGPFVGLTIVNNFTFVILFILCVLFSLLSLACGLMMKGATEQHRENASEANSPVNLKSGATARPRASSWHWSNFIETRAIPISVSGFIVAFSYGAISTFISVYAKSLSMTSIASYFFIVFAALILISRPFTGRLFDRLGEHILVYPGLVLFAGGLVLLSQASSGISFLAAGGIIGLGYGALIPSFQAIAVKSSSMERSGLANSTYYVFFDAGFGTGSYVLGVVAAASSYGDMYLISGAIVASSVVFYYVLHHRKQQQLQTGKGIA